MNLDTQLILALVALVVLLLSLEPYDKWVARRKMGKAINKGTATLKGLSVAMGTVAGIAHNIGVSMKDMNKAIETFKIKPNYRTVEEQMRLMTKPPNCRLKWVGLRDYANQCGKTNTNTAFFEAHIRRLCKTKMMPLVYGDYKAKVPILKWVHHVIDPYWGSPEHLATAGYKQAFKTESTIGFALGGIVNPDKGFYGAFLKDGGERVFTNLKPPTWGHFDTMPIRYIKSFDWIMRNHDLRNKYPLTWLRLDKDAHILYVIDEFGFDWDWNEAKMRWEKSKLSTHASGIGKTHDYRTVEGTFKPLGLGDNSLQNWYDGVLSSKPIIGQYYPTYSGKPTHVFDGKKWCKITLTDKEKEFVKVRPFKSMCVETPFDLQGEKRTVCFMDEYDPVSNKAFERLMCDWENLNNEKEKEQTMINNAFSKSDLKPMMRVELRNGTKLVLCDAVQFVGVDKDGDEVTYNLCFYDDDLTRSDPGFNAVDIVKVYSAPAVSAYLDPLSRGRLLWEREEEKKVLTLGKVNFYFRGKTLIAFDTVDRDEYELGSEHIYYLNHHLGWVNAGNTPSPERAITRLPIVINIGCFKIDFKTAKQIIDFYNENVSK